jgi:hypothetical protein
MKKGVKRKADTTTPVVAPSPYDPVYIEPLASVKTANKITPRRESNRQIKKPKRDLPDDQARNNYDVDNTPQVFPLTLSYSSNIRTG